MTSEADLQELEDLLSSTKSEAKEPIVEVETDIEDDYTSKALIVGKKSSEVEILLDYKQLQRDLLFRTSTLTTDFETQAALFASYAVVKSRAIYQSARFESEAKIVEATVYESIRAKAVKDGTKVTEAQLGKLAIMHKKTITAKSKAVEARAVEDLCWSALESLKQRRDMLVQAGADSREERKGNLVMRESTPTTDAVKKKLSQK